METTLLHSKLTIPPLRTAAVERRRLVARLNEGVGGKCTLIAAPAGYGKTTLTTQWLAQLDTPVCWVALDSGENDSGRFLAYFFAAIRTVREPAGATALARLSSHYEYNNPTTMLTTLLNDLATWPDGLVLVLDDYHLVTETAVHTLTTFIL
ncbi:MAG: AAA family ATPase, partial [Anaerolineales bacterium]|nr:AAA family ATPase [Anaerolineales bacterium]